MTSQRKAFLPVRAFSLVEVMVTVAVIGIMAGIAIPVLSNIRENAQREVAENTLARINAALTVHTQTGVPFVLNANNGSTADELNIMTMLTTKDPAVPGSPLLQGSGWPSAGSSDNKSFRLRWNGRFFEVLAPGQNGQGLKFVF